MIATRNLRPLGWTVSLAVAGALLFALALHVNALKSEVRRTELRIVALKHEKLYLETEFETRSNQQQLESWNDVDFGYVAPGPGQFIENERQLAALGKPAAAPLPAQVPVQVAAAARPSPHRAATVRPAKREAETGETGERAQTATAEQAAAARAEPAERLERIALVAGPATIKGAQGEVGR